MAFLMKTPRCLTRLLDSTSPISVRDECLCLSAPPSLVSVLVSLSISYFLSISVDFFISLSVILFLYPVCMPVCMCFFCHVIVSLPLITSLPLSLCVSVSRYASTSLCLCLCLFFSVSVSLHLRLCLFLFLSLSPSVSHPVPPQPPPPSTCGLRVLVPSLPTPRPGQLLTTSQSWPLLPASLGPWRRGAREEGRAAWRAHPFLPFQARRLGQWAF